MTTLKEMTNKDNPFDVVLHTALELARNALQLPFRFKDESSGRLSMDSASMDWQINRINGALKVLSNLSPEELQICKDTAYATKQWSDLNESLYKMCSDIPSEYTMASPRYDLEYEKAVFGEDSEEYKRRRYLDKLLATVFKTETYGLFSNITDYMRHGHDYCVEQFGWECDKLDKVSQVQSVYNFSEKDLIYLMTNIDRQDNNYL